MVLFGRWNRVCFEVRSGEVFGLLGPNGAGKTSIISTIVTLEKPTSGSVLIQGKEVSQHEREVKALTGVVPQETITHGYFNVEEILTFQSGYYGLMRNKKKHSFFNEAAGPCGSIGIKKCASLAAG